MGTGVIDFGDEDDIPGPSTSSKPSTSSTAKATRSKNAASPQTDPSRMMRPKRQSAAYADELIVVYTKLLDPRASRRSKIDAVNGMKVKCEPVDEDEGDKAPPEPDQTGKPAVQCRT